MAVSAYEHIYHHNSLGKKNDSYSLNGLVRGDKQNLWHVTPRPTCTLRKCERVGGEGAGHLRAPESAGLLARLPLRLRGQLPLCEQL